ncbi:MAG: hypothetical protein M1827_002541 [Pycnora praestabilis]|nr:MAG: hypothetical protein M1827_002541 [Pycnora praestabilis]
MASNLSDIYTIPYGDPSLSLAVTITAVTTPITTTLYISGTVATTVTVATAGASPVVGGSPSPSTPLAISSTRSSSVDTSTSSSATTSATGSAVPVSTTSGHSNTGAIAAAAVLGALFLIASAGLLFVLSRRRGSKRSLNNDSTPVATYETKNDPSTANLHTQISNLESKIASQDAQLRTSQAALLRSGRNNVGTTANNTPSLDDRTINERFQQLSKSINDWVLTYFKNIGPGLTNPPGELVELLQATQPTYVALLQNPRTKYLVVRGVVAQVLTEAWANGDFWGEGSGYASLEKMVGENGTCHLTSVQTHDTPSTNTLSLPAAPPSTLSTWRTLTLSHLSTNPSLLTSRTTAIQTLTQRIDALTSSFAEPAYAHSKDNNGRLTRLHTIVQSASQLHHSLSQQIPTYKILLEPPSTSFSPLTMEDVLQDQKGEALVGRPIKSVVFPVVTRWGTEEGEGWERFVVVCRALVLV